MSMRPVGWLGQDADRHEHCYSKHKTIEASTDVFAEGFKVVRVGDAVASHGGSCNKHLSPHGAKVQKGSASVFVNGKPMAREGDTVKCDTGQTAPLLRGRATVVAGDVSPVAGSRQASSSRTARRDPNLLTDDKGSDVLAGDKGKDSLAPSRIPGVRAYRRGPDGQFYEVDLSREQVYTGRLVPMVVRPIDPDSATRALAENAAPNTGSASNESGNIRPRRVYMGYDGYLSGTYIKAMAKIGQILKFGVEASVGSGDFNSMMLQLGYVQNLTIVQINREIANTWTEDDREQIGETTVIVPASLDGWVPAADIQRDRARRYPQEGVDSKPALRAMSSWVVGGVDSRGDQRFAAEAGLATGSIPVQARSYAEGGNTIMAMRADGTPYAVVGLDTRAATRANMDRTDPSTTGFQHMGKEAQRLIANDLGVNFKDIIFVEQSAFHIDMVMMVLPSGNGVVLNDSLEAARLQTIWMRNDYEKQRPPPGASQSDVDRWTQGLAANEVTMKILNDSAAVSAGLNAVAAKQLTDHGLPVYFVPGYFKDNMSPRYPEVPGKSNFLNSERGIAPDGTGYYIGLAGRTPEAEQAFMQQMQAIPGSGIDTFYFIGTPVTTNMTLDAQGGIGCRTKVIP